MVFFVVAIDMGTHGELLLSTYFWTNSSLRIFLHEVLCYAILPGVDHNIAWGVAVSRESILIVFRSLVYCL
jgi:hypothetical protein